MRKVIIGTALVLTVVVVVSHGARADDGSGSSASPSLWDEFYRWVIGTDGGDGTGGGTRHANNMGAGDGM